MLECQAPLMFSRTKEALLCFYGVLKGTNNQSEFQLFALLSTAFFEHRRKSEHGEACSKSKRPSVSDHTEGRCRASKAS